MAYSYSSIDRDNRNWMKSDKSCGTLTAISLTTGRLRGLEPFRVDLTYPISAIAGENGSGKSTLLAIAACAFHNGPDGFKLSDRSNPYYTFSDFFVQSNDEVSPSGITIDCQIRSRKRGSEPTGVWQTQTKGVNGRWSDYKRRVKRNVVYFGIQRVVPHYERTIHKSYRRMFQIGALQADIRNRIREIAGRILGRSYSDFELHEHSKYSLPVASWSGLRYSGFNMGAGESAVFQILTTLFASGRGTLLVIDEIELGLHEKAQKRLMEELKFLCNELHCQILCSTHSHVVLRSLPPEARFFIEARDGGTWITPGISPDYACGKLAGRNSGEVDVFVEDRAAQSILEASLPLVMRERIEIHPIGSAPAVLRQLSARYLEKSDDCVAVLDGDQRRNHQQSKNKIRTSAECRYRESEEEMDRWIDTRLGYLPGDTWPERCLVESAQSVADKTNLMYCWGVDSAFRIENALANALLAGKHREFFALHEEMQQEEGQIVSDLARFVNRAQPENMKDIEVRIGEVLAI